jgi:hypothetical protein
MCDKIEVHFQLGMGSEKKMDCLDQLIQVYKSIELQSSFKEKKSRIILLIVLLMDWNDTNLKSIQFILKISGALEGENVDFVEDETLVSIRCEILIQQRRLKECANYCKVVKNYEIFCRTLLALKDFKQFYQNTQHLNSQQSLNIFSILMKIRNICDSHDIYKSCIVLLCRNDSESFKKMVSKEFVLFVFKNNYEVDFCDEFKEIIIDDDNILKLFLDHQSKCSTFLGDILLEKFQNLDQLPSFEIMSKSLKSTQGFHKEQIFEFLCSKAPQELSKVISIIQHTGIEKEYYFVKKGLDIFKFMLLDSLENEMNKEEFQWLFNALKGKHLESLCAIIEIVYGSPKALNFKQSIYSPQNINNTFFIFKLINICHCESTSTVEKLLFDSYSDYLYPPIRKEFTVNTNGISHLPPKMIEFFANPEKNRFPIDSPNVDSYRDLKQLNPTLFILKKNDKFFLMVKV